MKALVLVAAAVACGPSPREAVPPDAVELPAGIWEPDPGAVLGGALVADGSDVWFATNRQISATELGVWLTKQTSSGEPLIRPTRADTPGLPVVGPAIAKSDASVVVAFRRGNVPQVDLRVFDGTGSPLRSADHRIPIQVDGRDVDRINDLRVVAGPGGSFDVVATFAQAGALSEVTRVGLDTAGDPTGAVSLMGITDEGNAVAVAAAVAADGQLLIAWDHRYDVCTSAKTSLTLADSVDEAGGVAPQRTVLDVPNTSELEPSIAVLGASAYVAWASDFGVRSTIALARHTDVSTVVTEIGAADARNHAPVLALTEPGRGAIAWTTDDPFELHVAGLREVGTGIVVGTSHTVPVVGSGSFVTISGLVAVGADRYVLAWTESGTLPRMFATAIDVSADPPRETPPPRSLDVPPARMRRGARPPCSH